MLESGLKEQLKGLFSELKHSYTLHIEFHPKHPKGAQMVEFLQDVAECSDKIECKIDTPEGTIAENENLLQFHILRDNLATGIIFRAIPNGHEFTSLVIAILNLDGKGKNLPDEFTTERIAALSGMINLTTYMALTCPNCPDVVQALNIVAMLNGRVTHEVVDGALFEAEADSLNIQSVPTVYADGELLHVGRGTLAELLEKLHAKYGSEKVAEHNVTRTFDVAIAGGGPAGATAAIYLARKGLKVAVVAQKIGGQVNDTVAIENIPSVAETTGAKLAQDLHNHMLEYESIAILENRTIESVDIAEQTKKLHVMGGETIEANQLIIATGAQWQKLGIDGEAEYAGRGVAYCPHCDGPLFTDKKVAVIGGGNSGVEAAIDLAGICKEVALIEFAEQLKADDLLQERVRELPNVKIFTNHQTTKIIGNGTTVNALEMKDRATDEMKSLELDGIFVQIGLYANSTLFADKLERNERGEIIVDNNGRTSVEMVYAAGDVTNVSYKQIVISMGAGAKAALALFDDKIRKK
ncbi:MAG: alkyl hydroperoxide reductase subunit F [Rikenellaceae bacterium]